MQQMQQQQMQQMQQQMQLMQQQSQLQLQQMQQQMQQMQHDLQQQMRVLIASVTGSPSSAMAFQAASALQPPPASDQQLEQQLRAKEGEVAHLRRQVELMREERQQQGAVIQVKRERLQESALQVAQAEGRAVAAEGALERQEQARECPVCLDGQRSHALAPCGHALCGLCAPRQVGRPCPECRVPVESQARVFLG